MNFLDERLPARFWDKVSPCPMSGCWLWTGADRNGYGCLRLRVDVGWRTEYAHRHAFMALVGRVPDGLELDHLCRVRACCNPEHLEPVTRRTNVLRGESPIARCMLVTHCPKGHAYAENARARRPGGGRDCKVCHRARERNRKRAA